MKLVSDSKSKCISLQIMHYGKVFWGQNIVLCKEPHGNKSLLIDNLPCDNLCEKVVGDLLPL